MSSYNDSVILAIDPAWSDNTAPLNQSREATRDDLRVMATFPVSLDSINTITRAMNQVAELSPEALASIEESLTEHKALEVQRTQVQSSATWDGAAPIKRADVVEYDTTLLAAKDAIVTQTQGINARMGQIEMEILTALGLGKVAGNARLYRS